MKAALPGAVFFDQGVWGFLNFSLLICATFRDFVNL